MAGTFGLEDQSSAGLVRRSDTRNRSTGENGRTCRWHDALAPAGTTKYVPGYAPQKSSRRCEKRSASGWAPPAAGRSIQSRVMNSTSAAGGSKSCLAWRLALGLERFVRQTWLGRDSPKPPGVMQRTHEGRRATDTLANERTYLAYVRTALAFIAFGFVIARFSLFAREFPRSSRVGPAPGISTLRNRDGRLRNLHGAPRRMALRRHRSRLARGTRRKALVGHRLRDLALRRRVGAIVASRSSSTTRRLERMSSAGALCVASRR